MKLDDFPFLSSCIAFNGPAVPRARLLLELKALVADAEAEATEQSLEAAEYFHVGAGSPQLRAFQIAMRSDVLELREAAAAFRARASSLGPCGTLESHSAFSTPCKDAYNASENFAAPLAAPAPSTRDDE